MASKTGTTTARKRGKGRPFQKGECANPAGRPAGSRNAVSLAIENLLDVNGEALTQRAIDQALGGDALALRLCLERLCPVRRERRVKIDWPTETDNAAGISSQFSALLKAVAGGELDVQQAVQLAQVLESHRRILETEQLEIRLAALEEKQNAPTA